MELNKQRPRFKKKKTTSRWVACISCGHEYVLEPYAGRPECPVCESRLYEDANVYPLLTIEDDYDDRW
jgi:uncharacterized CHY-type Zn-finger protein